MSNNNLRKQLQDLIIEGNQTYQEYAQYKSSVALVNKMYPFNAMANGKNDAGSTIEWIVPFPL